MSPEIDAYHESQSTRDKAICLALAHCISKGLPAAHSKIWHGHPVWFLDENPIVGYSKQKPGIRLMFWSGSSFQEDELNVLGKKFKDASIFYQDVAQINKEALKRWLLKAQNIQWDYKNIVKRKGELIRIK